MKRGTKYVGQKRFMYGTLCGFFSSTSPILYFFSDTHSYGFCLCETSLVTLMVQCSSRAILYIYLCSSKSAIRRIQNMLPFNCNVCCVLWIMPYRKWKLTLYVLIYRVSCCKLYWAWLHKNREIVKVNPILYGYKGIELYHIKIPAC